MNKILISLKNAISRSKCEKGIGLIEVLFAVVILGVVGLAYLNADTTAYKAIGLADDGATAQRAGQRTMDWEKRLETIGTDPRGDYPGYDIPAAVITDLDTFSTYKLQKITVQVNHDGQNLITLEGYRIYQ